MKLFFYFSSWTHFLRFARHGSFLLKEIYQEELEHSDIYSSLNGKPGLSFRIQISKDDKQSCRLTSWLLKSRKMSLLPPWDQVGGRKQLSSRNTNGKPWSLYLFLSIKGLKEEKKSFLSFITTLAGFRKLFLILFKTKWFQGDCPCMNWWYPVAFDFNDASAVFLFLPTVSADWSPINHYRWIWTPARSFRSSTKTRSLYSPYFFRSDRSARLASSWHWLELAHNGATPLGKLIP